MLNFRLYNKELDIDLEEWSKKDYSLYYNDVFEVDAISLPIISFGIVTTYNIMSSNQYDTICLNVRILLRLIICIFIFIY